MIICICCNVNNSQLDSIIEKSSSIQEVLFSTCVGCKCGLCLPEIENRYVEIKTGAV